MEGSAETPLETLRKLYEEWGRGDYASTDIFHPDMTMETFGMGEPMRAENYQEFIDAMRDWLRAWERPIRITADEFIESPNKILVMVHWSGRGRESGAQIDGQGAHLWTFRDGLVVRYEVYRDRDEARAALDAA